MLKLCCVLWLTITVCCWGNANSVYAVKDGYWSDTATWSTGLIPVPTDSVFINKYVRADTTIWVDKAGYLLIDLCGTLCGEHFISGSFTSYGNIYMDSAHITDSTFVFGHYTFQYRVVIYSATGYMKICCGGYGGVGPAPECRDDFSRNEPCTQSILSVDYEKSDLLYSVNVYPNPCRDYFTVERDPAYTMFPIQVYSTDGRLLQQVYSEQALVTIPVSGMNSGIYLIKHGKQYRKLVVE